MMQTGDIQSVGKWISVLHRQSQVYIGRQLKPYGLGASEYIYLVHLATEKGDINQKQLSDLIMIDNALTTRAMKSLEKKGYIIRGKKKSDQRCYTVKLTEKGNEIIPVILHTLDNWSHSILQGITGDETDYIIRNLMVMSQNALCITKGDTHEQD